MINDCIIMAGGSGTRLWPASTFSKPKQFLSLPAGSNLPRQSVEGAPGSKASRGKSKAPPFETFFDAAVERALAVIDETGDGRVVIIAGRSHIQTIVDECARLDVSKRKRLVLIPEPMPKHTAPAIACAVQYIDWVSRGAERNVMVLTSDHIIEPLNTFKADTKVAAAMARTNKLVVFGARPTRPETGYGYIETGKALTISPDKIPQSQDEPLVYSVASFREKPELEKAKKFMASKRFYWNLGMLAFSSKFMLDEFQRNAPEVITPFKKMAAPGKASYKTQKGLRVLDEQEKLEAAYQETKAISIEHALTEKCPSVVMVKAGFSWADVGSWDEYAHLKKHTSSEVYSSNEETFNTCFVDSDMPVALCGVEDLIVIARAGGNGKPPTVLISKKGETQHVKEIVEKIKAAGRTELL